MARAVTAERAAARPAAATRRGAMPTLSRVLFYLLCAVILVYTIFPFYWALRSSITPSSELFATPLSYFPRNPTLEHYSEVFRSGQFRRALLNSAIVSLSVTLLALVVGSLASYALGRFNFRGRTPVLYLVLSMTMFPQIAVLGSLFTMVQRLRLYNTLGALILTYMIFTLPFTVWVLTSFFKQMPEIGRAH